MGGRVGGMLHERAGEAQSSRRQAPEKGARTSSVNPGAGGGAVPSPQPPAHVCRRARPHPRSASITGSWKQPPALSASRDL